MAGRRVITNGPVLLESVDYGGVGPDLLLLHGALRTQRDFNDLAGRLSGHCRVITYDMRGHGRSTAGQWTFETALSDLQAVISAYGLTEPIVGGHSLGGIVALRYASEHPGCQAVVNIDGWGPGRAEEYGDADPAQVHKLLSRAARGRSHLLVDAPLSVAAVIPRARRFRDLTRAVVCAVHDVDVVALHRTVSCPILSFNATAPSGALRRAVLGSFARLSDVRRGELTRILTEMQVELPNLRVIHVAGGHMLMLTHPAEVADGIRRFAIGPVS